jgi:hypothetical protein
MIPGTEMSYKAFSEALPGLLQNLPAVVEEKAAEEPVKEEAQVNGDAESDDDEIPDAAV